jgi:elongation factor Ts
MTTVLSSDVKILRQKTGAPLMDCKKVLVEANNDMAEAERLLRLKGASSAEKKSSRETAEGKVLSLIADDLHAGVILEIKCETDFVARSDTFMEFSDEVAKIALAKRVNSAQELMAEKNAKGIGVEEIRSAVVTKLGENIQITRVITMESKGYIQAYTHSDRIAVLVAMEKENTALAQDIAMHITAFSPASISEKDFPEDILAKEKDIFATQAQGSNKPAEIVDKIVVGKIKKYLRGVTLYGQPFIKDQDIAVSEVLKKEANEVLSFYRLELGKE